MNSNRRTFLRGAGALIALPALESLGSAGLASQALDTGPAAFSNAPVKRLVTIGTYLGFHTPSWFPKETGAGYKTQKFWNPWRICDLSSPFFPGLITGPQRSQELEQLSNRQGNARCISGSNSGR